MRALLVLALLAVSSNNVPLSTRLLLPFAMTYGLVRQWFVISLPRATIVPLRREMHNLANWFQAIAFWTFIGGYWLYNRLTPLRG